MAEIDLAGARQASGMTQEAVAAEMGKSQENVSRIERQRDVRVSTLAQFIQAQAVSWRSMPSSRQASESHAGPRREFQAKRPARLRRPAGTASSGNERWLPVR